MNPDDEPTHAGGHARPSRPEKNVALEAALRRLVTTHKLLTRSEAENLARLLGVAPDAIA